MTGKWVYMLTKGRWAAVILGMLNMVVLILGMILICEMVEGERWSKRDVLAIGEIWLVCFLRIIVMLRPTIAQRATALLVVSQTEMGNY